MHFELTLCMEWDKVQFHSSACGYLVFLAPFIEETILSLECVGGIFAEDQLALNAWAYF
jgi:hypothetical protein